MRRHDIGFMVDAVKSGFKVARTGWNGKGMYLFYIGESMSSGNGWTFTNGKNDNCGVLPFIAMKTFSGEVVPWLCSQTDILAEDWDIVE